MTAVSVTDGVAHVIAAAPRQPTLRLALAAAGGHVLAEPLTAPWPLPSWTASSMDGYAVRAADVRGASAGQPVSLPLAGGSHAGDASPPPLEPGHAWRVATGGRVPEGADSVIRQEDASGEGRGAKGGDLVTFTSDRDAGRNIRPLGGDLASGAVALRDGTILGPGQVALLAALGVATPLVYRRPRVGILTSGDEITGIEHREAIANGQRLADVNTPMLSGLVQQAGGVPIPIALVPDRAEALADAVRAAGDVDLLLTAGGVSVGEHDHVPGVMAGIGARVVFRRVRVRPGGPTTLAVLPDGRPWLALPGNPVSAFVTFHLFARPAIRAMMGDPAPRVPLQDAVLGDGERVARHPSLDLYLRVTLERNPAGGPPVARLTGEQGSWVLSSIARADGLVVVEAGTGRAGAGERVPMLGVNGDW